MKRNVILLFILGNFLSLTSSDGFSKELSESKSVFSIIRFLRECGTLTSEELHNRINVLHQQLQSESAQPEKVKK